MWCYRTSHGSVGLLIAEDHDGDLWLYSKDNDGFFIVAPDRLVERLPVPPVVGGEYCCTCEITEDVHIVGAQKGTYYAVNGQWDHLGQSIDSDCKLWTQLNDPDGLIERLKISLK